jgi:ATP-dependent Clp protease ATP-binding subunit ClpA
MFEKYTEKARRVIFFARYEASQFGQPYIETEHLMLGILREDKFISLHGENAIANHEFEKARFYSDEERKEKENLRVLRERHHLSDSPSIVGRENIEEVVSRWSAYPYCP